MQTPSITGFYLALLALIYAALALQVARLRRGNRVLFGDGENVRLRCVRGTRPFMLHSPNCHESHPAPG